MATSSMSSGGNRMRAPMQNVAPIAVAGDAFEVDVGSIFYGGEKGYTFEHQADVTASGAGADVVCTITLPNSVHIGHGLVIPYAINIIRDAAATGTAVTTLVFKDFNGGTTRIIPAAFTHNSALLMKKNYFSGFLIATDTDKWIVSGASVVSEVL
jgi:hypothetical protein